MPLSQVGVQITNACDGGCIMCARRTSKREVHHMKPSELQKLVDEIKALGIKLPTGIGGVGEPTLHPSFCEMVTIISKIPWCFGTNCNSLIPTKSHWVITHKPEVVALSIDAVTQNTMSAVRPGINFGIAEYYAKRFIRRTRGTRDTWLDPKLFVQMVVMNQNVHELDEWVETWLGRIPADDKRWVLHVKEVIEWPGIDGAGLWSPAVKKALDRWAGHPRIQVSYRAPIRASCQLMQNFAWIMSNGAYSPCCMHADDLWFVGNALESSIKECYESAAMSDLRTRHSLKGFSGLLCERCK